jgi:hypothetical protein
MDGCCKAGIPFAHARHCCQIAQISANMIFSHIILSSIFKRQTESGGPGKGVTVGYLSNIAVIASNFIHNFILLPQSNLQTIMYGACSQMNKGSAAL